MGDRSARRVVSVPDVVGMPFHIARDVAARAGVALANPDPDGPPIAALAWPGLYYVVRQEPQPGTRLREWDSLRIEVVKHGDAPERAPAEPVPSPPADTAHAAAGRREQPQPEEHIDLTRAHPPARGG